MEAPGMTDTSGALPPAGWYPDPYGAPYERWWDGAAWTEHTNTPATTAPEPEAAPYAAPVSAAQPEPEPAPYTPPAAEPQQYAAPAEPTPAEPAADPFASFAAPSAAAAQPGPVWPQEPAEQTWQSEPPAQDPFQAPAYEPVSAFETPAFETPAYEAPTFQQPDFEAQPAQQAPSEPAQPAAFGASAAQPASIVPAPGDPFDFGFGQPVHTGSGETPQSGDAGDSGLFGSWAPDGYAEPARNGAANAGLAFGILSLFFSALAGLPGIILSAVGIGRAGRFAREGDGPVGRGKAITGLVLSVVGSAASAAVIVFGLTTFNLLGFGTPKAAPSDDATGGASNVPVDFDEDSLTQNGGIPLEVGALGTILMPDGVTGAIQFTVTGITPNFACTASGAKAPENGEFIAVAMDFTVNADYAKAMEDGAKLAMNESDWIGLVNDEAGTQISNTEAGTTCIAAAEQFPAELATGNSSGMVVLDMSKDVTSISWSPVGVKNLDPGSIRWEWTVE